MVWHELIDTLWNVNGSYLSHFGGHLLELIDTLWNVNQQYPQYPQYPQPGINRYIMECKWWNARFAVAGFPELIDTLWNVNNLWYNPFLISEDELIDTLWNVNVFLHR